MEMEQRSLVNELKQGKELAKQLRNHLNPSSSEETRQFLVEKILSSYEKALSLLNWAPLVLETQHPAVNPTLGSPQSSFANTSPRSDGSNLEWKDQCSKGAHKKRYSFLIDHDFYLINIPSFRLDLIIVLGFFFIGRQVRDGQNK